VMVTQALPQTLSALSPFVRMPVAETAFTVYAADGFTIVDKYFSTLYVHRGGEIALSSNFPGRPFRTAVRTALDATGFVWYLISEQFERPYEENEWADDVQHGCMRESVPVVARETI